MGKIIVANMVNVRRRPSVPYVCWPWTNARHPAVNSWAGYGQINKFVAGYGQTWDFLWANYRLYRKKPAVKMCFYLTITFTLPSMWPTFLFA